MSKDTKTDSMAENKPKEQSSKKKFEPKNQKNENISIDMFFSQSRAAKQRGAYIETAFRRYCITNKISKGLRQSETKWEEDLKKFAEMTP
jgi:hypothetical protein